MGERCVAQSLPTLQPHLWGQMTNFAGLRNGPLCSRSCVFGVDLHWCTVRISSSDLHSTFTFPVWQIQFPDLLLP